MGACGASVPPVGVLFEGDNKLGFGSVASPGKISFLLPWAALGSVRFAFGR